MSQVLIITADVTSVLDMEETLRACRPWVKFTRSYSNVWHAGEDDLISSMTGFENLNELMDDAIEALSDLEAEIKLVEEIDGQQTIIRIERTN